MSIWSTLFGSKNVIQAGIDGLDKIVHTDEEKSDAKQIFLKLYEPFKVAQRLLAVIYGVPYAFAWFITFIVSFFTDVSKQEALLQGDISRIVFAIVSFYFGGGAAEGVVRMLANRGKNSERK
jgi:hypothetical protein